MQYSVLLHNVINILIHLRQEMYSPRLPRMILWGLKIVKGLLLI